MSINFRNAHCSRRDALSFGLLGLTGLSLSELLHAAEKRPLAGGKASADAVLFINLAGGPSHLDTLDMKPDGPADTKGEFQPIQSKIPGLMVCEHLPGIAAAADRFTLIRGISHSAGAHPQGQAYISTGNRPTPAVVYPSYGAVIAREFPGEPDIPPQVAIPQTEWSAGFLGDAFAAFKTNTVPEPGKPFNVRGISLAEGLTLEKVNRRQQILREIDQTFAGLKQDELVEALDTFGQRAHGMITSPRTQAAFDVSAEPASIQKLFASDELGQSLLLATRLIEHGVRFITVTNPGWDTHLDNFAGHRRLMPPLDAAVVATLTALQTKGLLERTLVVVMGEFGRTPKINSNVGRDHYPRAGWCIMAGGGVRPGQLLGATNDEGTGPTDDTQIAPDDLGASIYRALGIDHHKEYYTRTGRPVSLIPNGRVLGELFG